MKTGSDDQTHNIVSYSDTLEPQKVIAEKHEPSPKKSTVLKFNPDGSLCIPAELKEKISQQNPKTVKSVKSGIRRRFTGPKSRRPVDAGSDSGNEAASSSETPLAPNPATFITSDQSSDSSINPAKPSDEIEILAEREDPNSTTNGINTSACYSPVDRQKGKRKKSYNQLPGKQNFSSKPKEGYCHFCFTNVEGKEVGELKTCGEITAHYKCLLFSSGLMQHGSNDDDLWGFMVPDVKKELARGKRLKCTYCKQSGALVGCHKTRCPCSYHLTCGMDNGCLMQFYDSFRSYCNQHRPLQYFVKEMIGLTVECPVCREDIDIRDKIVPNEILVTECCNMTPIHRKCIQTQADASGYFFRCPMCNNEKKYNSIMKIMGVNIPQRDAAWEKDGYYDDLLEEYWRCDVPICMCEEGRAHDSRNKDLWDLLKCNTCGQSGAHPACLGYDKKGPKAWQCRNCIEILAKIEEDRVKEAELKEAEQQKAKEKKKDALIQSFAFDGPCSSRDPAPQSDRTSADVFVVGTTELPEPASITSFYAPASTSEPSAARAKNSTPAAKIKISTPAAKMPAAKTPAAKTPAGKESKSNKKKRSDKVEKKPLPPDRDPFLMTPRKLKEAVYQLCVAKLKADKVVGKDVDVDKWTTGVVPLDLGIDSESDDEIEIRIPSQKLDLKPRKFSLIITKAKCDVSAIVIRSESGSESSDDEVKPVKAMSIFQQYSHGVRERKWARALKMYSKGEEQGDVTRIKYSGPSSKQQEKEELTEDDKCDEAVELIWNSQPSSTIMSTKNISFLIKQHDTKEEELKITKVENSVTAETLEKMTTTFYRISEEFEMDPTLMGLIEAKTGSIRSQTNIDRATLEGILTFVKARVLGESTVGEGVVVSADEAREIFEMISKILAGEKTDEDEVKKSNNELLSHLLTLEVKEEPSPSSSTTSNLENLDPENTKRKLSFDADVEQEVPKKRRKSSSDGIVVKLD